MRCDLSDDVVGGDLPVGKILDGVNKCHSVLLQTALDRGIEYFQDISAPVRMWIDVLREVQTQFESFQPIGVDQTEVELEHIR